MAGVLQEKVEILEHQVKPLLRFFSFFSVSSLLAKLLMRMSRATPAAFKSAEDFDHLRTLEDSLEHVHLELRGL